MRPPDPSQPVLFRTSRQLAIYRYVLPAAVLVALAFVAWSVPAGDRDALAPYVLPAAVFLGGLLLHGRNLRAATVTESGVVLSEGGTDYLVEWTDIDWATELWMNPPTLVVRLKPEVPLLPAWFLLLPPRERRFIWKAQPMSQFIADKAREARAGRPEHALEYGGWPSRAGLTLRVTGTFLLLFLGALALAAWLQVRHVKEELRRDRDPGPPISASLQVAGAAPALTPGRPNA